MCDLCSVVRVDDERMEHKYDSDVDDDGDDDDVVREMNDVCHFYTCPGRVVERHGLCLAVLRCLEQCGACSLASSMRRCYVSDGDEDDCDCFVNVMCDLFDVDRDDVRHVCRVLWGAWTCNELHTMRLRARVYDSEVWRMCSVRLRCMLFSYAIHGMVV
jgi:hypothetical protein